MKRAEEKMYYYLSDGERRKHDAITEEDLERTYAVIDGVDFAPREGIREDIVNIIVEEMSPCLSGVKSYETAAVVQNRVRNMVQEEIR